MRLLVATLFLVAGCADPEAIAEPPAPDETPIWMSYAQGCGFCDGTDAPWASAVVLYPEAEPMWLSWRPETGMQGDDIDGVEMPSRLEPMRAEIELALDWLREGGAYWAKQEDIHVFDAHRYQWSANQESAFLAEIGPHLGTLQTPPVYEYRCTDVGFPNLHVWRDGNLHGDIPGSQDDCANHPHSGYHWERMSDALRDLHDEAEAS